ncbi:hypothetical protein [Dyadobacter luticola]|uniref:Uncharacterized protein n=1 Tax=Dyadobacter luticola TaxID=1979387 RepID=A0A5R9L4V1_9BACT|nr:hypothetical protein [Dyadobacter luticola]TLV03387.1 hypothetical protein FEN17_07205 [Dyadobacter luticola]
MGRLLSILLFCLLLYNMIGYPVAYLLEGGHATSGKSSEYVERQAFSEDIVIKVPVSLPYQVSWDNPEPAEGKIRHEGGHYRMKTRQLVNDTMYVHCEIDQNARDRYTMLVSKIQDEIGGGKPHKNTPSKVLKNFLKEFLSLDRKHVFYVLEWTPPHLPVADQYQFAQSAAIIHVPSPPPNQG